jgi:hypothetical protein
VDLSPITLRSASGHYVDCALNVLLLLEIDDRYFNGNTWHESKDRTLWCARPVIGTDASGRLELSPNSEPMALFIWGSINSWWPALGEHSWHFDHLDILLS